MSRICRWPLLILCRYGQTLFIATIARELRSELADRAEHALRYGIHKPRAVFLRR